MRIFYLFIFVQAALVVPPCLGQSPPWQQRVAYEIDVRLDTDRHLLAGEQRLTYYNNSPDTLYEIFYHLYFNAFHPQSMMAERNRRLPDPDSRIVPRIFNLGPDEVGYQNIQWLSKDGEPLEFAIFDTVLRAELAEPLLPGQSAVFEMAFSSQVPLQTRRSGRDNREGVDYSMSQWYPKVAAYDHHGWHPAPYVGREFYAPFGTFDVRITLPSRYVVGATGVLQNPAEIGHGYHDQPVDHAGRDSLTWHFYAENVHDFAWAADPDYIHERLIGPNNVSLHLLYLPEVADRWQSMHQWLPAMLDFFNQRFGEYPFPQFTVAQAGDGGMEYPMMTFITGRRSPISLASVTAHELAHMWYYGVIGFNETRYSWLDEGLTTFATEEVMTHLFRRQQSASHLNSHLNFLFMHELGLAEPINTPADWFETNRAFGATAYAGGAMFVDMLGYVISDSLRDVFLLRLFEEYQFRHPDPTDIKRLAERVSGLNLDWYFDQWLNTTRTLDYAITNLRTQRTEEGWWTGIYLRRNEEIAMPIDLRLTLDSGEEQWVNIPLGVMQGHKPVPVDWIVAEPWAWTFQEYSLELTLTDRVIRAEIDPLGRTPDRKRLNNSSDRLPVQVAFLNPPPRDYFHYGLGWRPLVDYAYGYGPGGGIQVRGSYVFDRYPIQATFKLWPMHRGQLPTIDYGIHYSTSAQFARPLSRYDFRVRKHLGVVENIMSLTIPLGRYPALRTGEHSLAASAMHQRRLRGDRGFRGMPSPNHPHFFAARSENYNWAEADVVSARIDWQYRVQDDRLEAMIEFGGSLSDELPYGASRMTLVAQKGAQIGLFRGRALVTLGAGDPNLAPQKRFTLGASTAETQWRTAAYRSISSTMEHALSNLHFAPFSGSGPVAYLLSDVYRLGVVPPDARPSLFPGTNMLAGNVSVSARPRSGNEWLAPLEGELFSGIGTVWNRRSELTADNLLVDAGIGFSYDVGALSRLARWRAQSDVLSGLHLAARFPFWVSHPHVISPDEPAFNFRLLLGVIMQGQ